MTLLPVRPDFADRPLVYALWPKLPGFRRNDSRARRPGRSHEDLPLGATIAPALDKRCCPYLKPTNDSWQAECKIKETSKYFYQSVDSAGITLNFKLSAQ